MTRFVYGRAPLRRRVNRFVPKTKALATVSGVATQTLAPYGKTQTGKVIAAAVATQTLAPYGKTQAGKVIASGSAVQQLTGYGQTATGKVIVTGVQEP